jgi:pentose-5-phosphate-3-epimerase
MIWNFGINDKIEMGLVLNPSTIFPHIIMNKFDCLLILGVNPGLGGKNFNWDLDQISG